MMDDVTDKKEDGTSTFNQPEWKKLNAMVPVSTLGCCRYCNCFV